MDTLRAMGLPVVEYDGGAQFWLGGLEDLGAVGFVRWCFCCFLGLGCAGWDGEGEIADGVIWR